MEKYKLEYVAGGKLECKILVFSPDSQFLYIGSKNYIHSYSVETGEKVANYYAGDSYVLALKIHPNNSSILISCSVEGEIYTWKIESHLLLISKRNIGLNSLLLYFDVTKTEKNKCNAVIVWTKTVGIFSLDSLECIDGFDITFTNAFAVGNWQKSPFLAIMSSLKVLCLQIKTFKKVHFKSGSQRKFKCIACHPEKDCVATGDDTGRILIWNKLFEKGIPTKAIYHWHTLPVNTIAFSDTGSILYSGGAECVVVKWKLESLKKDFLPRLPDEIIHLQVSKFNNIITIATKDKAIYIVSPQFKIKSIISSMTWCTTTSAGLTADLKNKSIIMNGYIGNIQFYSPFTKTLLYNVDVVGQNKVTRERNAKIPNTNVKKVAITSTGEWLATVEDRLDENVYKEIRLKFFQFDSVNQEYKLNTSVEYPHEDCIIGLELQNISSPYILCATIGKDKMFKIWRCTDAPDLYRNGKIWLCLTAGDYKNLTPTVLSFSMDGSLLAIAFEHCLTVWIPNTCELKCSLVHPLYHEPLIAVKFGNFEQGHFIVTGSLNSLNVWNILTLGLVRTVSLAIRNIYADPLSTYIAAVTPTSIHFFIPGSQDEKTTHSYQIYNIKAACFVPHGKTYSKCYEWQKMSQFFFTNLEQQLYTFAMKDSQQQEETWDFRYNNISEKTLFGALIPESTLSSVENPKNNKEIDLSHITEVKKFLQPPCHTMAPMRLLCKSFLQVLVLKDKNTNIDKKQEIDNEDESFVEFDEATSDNEPSNDLNKENFDTLAKKKKVSVTKRKKKSSFGLTESFDWTSSLFK